MGVAQVPVALIGISQVDWKQFITLCQDAVGYSPTRGLDACATPTHSDPAAFIACLDLANKPLEALKHGRKRGLLRHFFFSFYMVLEEETLQALNQETNLSTHATKTRREMLVLASGSTEQWHDAILAGCRPDSIWQFRAAMNSIYNMLLGMGFREAFPYNRIEHRDRTFSLIATKT